MSLVKLATNYADYNAWVTQKFADWLSPKPENLLYKEVPSSYSSIIKTLDHIWATEEYWYSVISETPGFSARPATASPDAKQVFSGAVKRSILLADLIRSYSEQDLSKTVKIESPWFQCE